MSAVPLWLLAAAMALSNDTVLLEFTAEWCAPCRTMEPVMRRLQEAGYPVRQVDVDRNRELAQQFAVHQLPCFVLVANGRERERVVGAAGYDRLVRLFHPSEVATPPHTSDTLRGLSPDARAGAENARGGADTAAWAQLQAPAASSPALRSTSSSLSPQQAQQRAMAASVRITVVDATGQSYGTGTIIDAHGQEALVLTCGHLFRESRGRGEIRVEMFVPGAGGPVPGQLISYKAEQRDIGLVSFRPPVPVVPVPVAGTDYCPRLAERVFSIGCDHGAEPTVRETTISAIDRYMGPPHIEIHGHPVLGRSGGGLFTVDGLLIGVCNAADTQEDRGIYAGLPTIHLELKEIGQERIFLPRSDAPVISPLVHEPAVASGLAITPAVHEPNLTPHASSPTSTELICVIRSRDGSTGQEQVLVIDAPSADLLRLLGQESRRAGTGPGGPSVRPTHADTARHLPESLAVPPIVRAQGR